MLGGLFLGASGSGLLGTGNGVHKVPSSRMSWRVGGGARGVVDVVERGVGGNNRRENGGMGKGYVGPMDCAGKLAMVNSPGLVDMKVHLFCPDPPPARATVAIFKGGSSSVWTRHGPARFSAELSPTEQPFGKRSWRVKAGHSSHLLWRPEPNIHNTSPLPPRVPPPMLQLSVLLSRHERIERGSHPNNKHHLDGTPRKYTRRSRPDYESPVPPIPYSKRRQRHQIILILNTHPSVSPNEWAVARDASLPRDA